MKILVTGSEGFIAKNLIEELKNQGFYDILTFNRNNTEFDLLDLTKKCDFVFHLAGVNRPNNLDEFKIDNSNLTETLLNFLIKNNNLVPVLLSSSIQSELENPYGISKKISEELVFNYSIKYEVPVFIYQLNNVFGKWCKPNYNSAIATFCHNIAREIPIKINDTSVSIKSIYIDDVVQDFAHKLKNINIKSIDKYQYIKPIFELNIQEIVDLIYSFKENRINLEIPNMNDLFTKNLYSTYLSYLPEDKFNYLLKMNIDNRGSFTEFLKTNERGQVSINISKPNITKGNHWHHTKNEKFLVVSGIGVIRFRKINSDHVISYYVSGEKLEVIDIPVGYTHNIENIGNNDMVTVMWVNEIFDKNKPDTYSLEV
jgi:UDP-2-acetamido-2,6-beta-L-arabino-hexul-4-ose reductase